MKKDFGKYKSEISLPDFLINNFDFVPVDGSSFCYPKLQSWKTKQVIVVKMNKQGFYTYFDVHNDTIKGCTIFDFLQKELAIGNKAPSLIEISNVLDNYIKEGKVLKPDSSKYYLTATDNDLNILLKEVVPLKDRTFLHSRGISDETIDSSLFKNIFFEREYIKGENRYVNLIIKLFNKEGVAGLSQRNSEFKGCLLSRFDSLATSEFDKDRPIDIFFIGESMLDAASHFELNKERLEGLNVVYFSAEGSLALGQLELFQSAVTKKQPMNIVSIFDKDIPGQEFNLKLYGNLVLKESGKNITTEVIKNDLDSTITLNLTMPKQIAEEKIKNHDHKFFSESIQGEVTFLQSNLQKGENVQWQITFPRTYENINAFVGKLKELRLSGEKISRHIPLTNDFNDDLRAMKGMHHKWRIDNIDGNLIGIKLEEKKNISQQIINVGL